MSSFSCERCGGSASVTVSRVPPNRRRSQSPPTTHHYCRECAKALGVPLRERGGTAPDISEPGLPTWADVELYLAQCESALRTDPAVADHVFDLAARMMEFCEQLPGPMPATVREAFARIGVSTSGEGKGSV